MENSFLKSFTPLQWTVEPEACLDTDAVSLSLGWSGGHAFCFGTSSNKHFSHPVSFGNPLIIGAQRQLAASEGDDAAAKKRSCMMMTCSCS